MEDAVTARQADKKLPAKSSIGDQALLWRRNENDQGICGEDTGIYADKGVQVTGVPGETEGNRSLLAGRQGCHGGDGRDKRPFPFSSCDPQKKGSDLWREVHIKDRVCAKQISDQDRYDNHIYGKG